jgi:uncharacterized cupredoxin-like copper-binding protein
MKALCAALMCGCLAVAALAGCGGEDRRTATIDIRYSRFQADLVTTKVGEPITITLRNDDPIEHEWIVGTEEVHQRHRTGTEPYHDTRPTEVTVPAFSERITTVVFTEPGDYRYICHLPGHEQYGMVGTLRVER